MGRVDLDLTFSSICRRSTGISAATLSASPSLSPSSAEALCSVHPIEFIRKKEEVEEEEEEEEEEKDRG